MADQTLAIFTICSNNYVPMARLFLQTAARFHPQAALYLCLADELVEEEGFYPDGCTVVTACSLAIPDFAAFSFRYDVMEFNTALKPFMFRRLLALGYRAVLYFDPDIEIFTPLGSVMQALDQGASFVLTPHLCSPSEGDAYPNDIGIMRAGVYNLGFLGVGASDEADSVLRWWSRRLQYQCVNDQAAGIFVDQKFVDLVPGFADRVAIVRDTSLNVAYWNLAQRTLCRQGDTWMVDGGPLGFFHYSGFDPKTPTCLSKHTGLFRDAGASADLRLLMQAYAGRLLDAGFGTIPASLYAYGKFRSGTVVGAQVRQAFRDNHKSWSGNPFANYEAYLALPAAARWEGPAACAVTNLMALVHRREPWLRANFDPASPDSARHFTEWFIRHAEHLVSDPRLIEPVAEKLGDQSPPHRAAPSKQDLRDPDVDVVGYLRLAMGVAEAGRLTLRCLVRAGIQARGVAISLNSEAAAIDHSVEPLLSEYSRAPVQLFAVNADQIGEVIGHLGPVLRSDAYRIIAPFWELAELPRAWIAAFAHVDEVWAPTRFIQTMLARSIGKPVVRMPMMLEFEPPPPMPRSRLGLPRETFLFFFAFDYMSFFERKNPGAVVEAFRRAFRGPGRSGRAALVLKTLNADLAPERGIAFRESLADDPDVILIERTLTRPDTLALIAACDAVVSLHRSEGLGLLVAEAMVLGKPVIATDYSATTELVLPHTGYPVDYKLIDVAAGAYPFPDGQKWADADIDHAAWQMRAVYRGGAPVQDRVAAARAHVAANYGHDAVAARQRRRLRLIGALS